MAVLKGVAMELIVRRPENYISSAYSLFIKAGFKLNGEGHAVVIWTAMISKEKVISQNELIATVRKTRAEVSNMHIIRNYFYD